jgi:hypothetical protein
MTGDAGEVVDNQPRTAPNRHVQEVLKTLHEELRGLNRQRTDVTRRIETIKRVVVGLSKMYGAQLSDEQLDDFLGRKLGLRRRGLTDACRRILLEEQQPLGARDVRDRVMKVDGELLRHHKDPIASLVTVLNRLVEYGEARRVTIGSRHAWVSAGEE